MTSPQFSGIPTPVAGVTGGQGLPAGVAAVDGSTGNVVIQPPNNVIQQQKGAIPQTFQVYETFTNNSNYIRVSLSATAGGPFRLRTEFAGSGVTRNLVLGAGNTDYWRVNGTTGALEPTTDNITNLGSGTNRIYDITSSHFIQGAALITLGQVNFKSTTNLWGDTGVPAVGLGNNGDYYLRFDGVAGNHIYFKSAGAWTALV